MPGEPAAGRPTPEPVKLVLTLLVRDEEDIIEANLRYHLARGVDEIIVTDNGSVDRTKDILDKSNRGGRVHVIEEPEDTYAQALWVTRMAIIAAKELGADWVIHGDADEFWWPHQGDLRETLAAVSPDVGVLECHPVNFVPLSDSPGFDAMTIREQQSFAPDGSPLPPKVIHRAGDDVAVGQGNHEVAGVPGSVATGAITIFHYPLRSFPQFDNKIAKGGAAYERNTDLDPGVGGLWRELYQLRRAGELEEWYLSRTMTRREAIGRVAAGELVEDRRLAQFLIEDRYQQIAELESIVARRWEEVDALAAEAVHRRHVIDELVEELDHRQKIIDELAGEARHRLDVIEGLAAEAEHRLTLIGELTAQRDRLASELAQLEAAVADGRFTGWAVRRRLAAPGDDT